jgi:hypothetical protein
MTLAPETTDLDRLWQAIEPVLVCLDLHEQLAVGGAVIEHLATLGKPSSRPSRWPMMNP